MVSPPVDLCDRLSRIFRNFDRGAYSLDEILNEVLGLAHDALSPHKGQSENADGARRLVDAVQYCARTDRCGALVEIVVLTAIQRAGVAGSWAVILEERILPLIEVGDEKAADLVSEWGTRWWSDRLLQAVADRFPHSGAEGGATAVARRTVGEQLERCIRQRNMVSVDAILDDALGVSKDELLARAVATVSTILPKVERETWWERLRPRIADIDWIPSPRELLVTVSYCVSYGDDDLARLLLGRLPDLETIAAENVSPWYEDARGYATIFHYLFGDKDVALKWSRYLSDEAMRKDARDDARVVHFSEFAGWILAQNLTDPREKITVLKRSESRKQSLDQVKARRDLLAAEAYLDLRDAQLAAYFLHRVEQRRDGCIYRGWEGFDPGWSHHALAVLTLGNAEVTDAHRRLADLGYQVSPVREYRFDPDQEWANHLTDDGSHCILLENSYACAIVQD